MVTVIVWMATVASVLVAFTIALWAGSDPFRHVQAIAACTASFDTLHFSGRHSSSSIRSLTAPQG